MEEFGKALRKLLDEQGISQRELAIYSDLEPCSVTLYLQGKRNPTIKTIERIAIALDVPLERLTGGKSKRQLIGESLADRLMEMRGKHFLNMRYDILVKDVIRFLKEGENGNGRDRQVGEAEGEGAG